MIKRLGYVLIGILLLTTNVQAQDGGQTASVNTSSDVSISTDGLVSFDFRDADIRNVFKILSLKSGVNIVASPEVSGLVTIELNNVPWKEALNVILQTYGFAYEQKGNIILVSTVDNLKKRREDATILSEQEPLETRIFSLNFGKAQEVVVSIEKMKSERGSVDYDLRTNTIIVTDTPNQLDQIEGVVGQLDRTTPQVLIEAKIVETTISDTENLGIDWTTQISASGAARPIIWPFDNETDNRFAPDAFPGAEDTEFSYGTLNFTQVSAVMELLRSRSNTDVLQNPRIVTLDNKPAQIVVGSQYPIPTYTYNEEQARLQVNGWEYMDIGIIFDVTPHVNTAGYVTLDVEPKITAILDFVTVENTSLPRLSNESTKTSVLVKDGDTLVIAGLITDQVTDTKKKTPILGDIPMLGLLFTKSDESITKTDLIIFITPHIVTPDINKS